jgi:hypothetical protein
MNAASRPALIFRQVRNFLSWNLERAASSEVVSDAQSSASTLSDLAAMKLSLRPASLVLARLGQSLQSLQESLKGWVPQQAPVLVPIRITANRRIRAPVSRHPWR